MLLSALVCICAPGAYKQIMAAGVVLQPAQRVPAYILYVRYTKEMPCFGGYVVKGGLCLHSQRFFNGWIETSAVRLLRLLHFSSLAALMSSFLVIRAKTALLHPSPQINGPV